MSSTAKNRATKSKPTSIRLKKSRIIQCDRSTSRTILERLGDALVADIRTRGMPYVSVRADLPSWSDVDAPLAFREVACPAVPEGDRRVRPPLEKDIISIEARLLHVDVTGTEDVSQFSLYGDDRLRETYPDSSICSQFALLERLFVNRSRGKKKRQEAMEQIDRELAALLSRLRAVSHCDVTVAYRIETKRPKSTTISAIYVDLLSRFGPDAPSYKISHNAHLLDESFPSV